MRHYIRAGSLALLFVLSTGCANYTRAMKAEEPVKAGDAYFYGRFDMDSPKAFLGLDGYQTMGFVFTCGAQKKYTIRFSVEKPVQVIRVAPGTCSWKETVFTDADGTIDARNPAIDGVMKDIKLEPGVAYYLGDFFGGSYNEPIYNGVRRNWKMTAVKHNFEKTTEAVRTAYPKLADVRMEDRMTAPEMDPEFAVYD